MHISHNDKSRFSIVVVGCGNTLLGDDGFGPEVVRKLSQRNLPAAVEVIDAGTSIREYLLDFLLLPALRPQLLIVVDAACVHATVGHRVRECGPEDIASRKVHDFSLHQFPSVNLLCELKQETGIEVVLYLAPLAHTPDVICPGLSSPMQAAVIEACDRILDKITEFFTTEKSCHDL